MIFVREHVKLDMKLMMHEAFLHEDKTFLIFIKPRPTCLRMTLPTMGYAFLCQLVTRKCPRDILIGKLDTGSMRKIYFKGLSKRKTPITMAINILNFKYFSMGGVSLGNLHWPGIHFIIQVGLKLKDTPASASFCDEIKGTYWQPSFYLLYHFQTARELVLDQNEIPAFLFFLKFSLGFYYKLEI